MGHSRAVGLSACAELGACQKQGREGLKPAGSCVKDQGDKRTLLVPAASDLCALAGSAVMAMTIKYDGSWSSAAVLFVSQCSGVRAWLAPSLGTPRFCPVAIPGHQRSWYDDQKGPFGGHVLQSPPKAKTSPYTPPFMPFLHLTPTLSCHSGGGTGQV